MVAAKRKKNTKGVQNMHIKTRGALKLEEREQKLANRKTIMLHKEKMLKNMSVNKWKAIDVADFYSKNGVTISRKTIYRWKQDQRTNVRMGRPRLIDAKGDASIFKKVHEHNNTSLTCTYETFRECCNEAAMETAARVRPHEGIGCFNTQINFIALTQFTRAQIRPTRNHFQIQRMRDLSSDVNCCRRV